MYFGFKYGILFDGRIITRNTRKSHRNTENKKNRLSVCCTSPAPTRNPQKSTEFTKRGAGVGMGHPPLREPGGEAFEYILCRIAFSFFAGVLQGVKNRR